MGLPPLTRFILSNVDLGWWKIWILARFVVASRNFQVNSDLGSDSDVAGGSMD